MPIYEFHANTANCKSYSQFENWHYICILASWLYLHISSSFLDRRFHAARNPKPFNHNPMRHRTLAQNLHRAAELRSNQANLLQGCHINGNFFATPRKRAAFSHQNVHVHNMRFPARRLIREAAFLRQFKDEVARCRPDAVPRPRFLPFLPAA